jgi:hypothetical protein
MGKNKRPPKRSFILLIQTLDLDLGSLYLYFRYSLNISDINPRA